MSEKNSFAATWCLNKFELNASAEVKKSDVWKVYLEDNESCQYKLVTNNMLNKLLHTLLPVKSRHLVDRATGKRYAVYKGIQLRRGHDSIGKLNSLDDICLPSDVVRFPCELASSVRVGVLSDILCNGNDVIKFVTFLSTEWRLEVRSTPIQLNNLHISNQFQPTVDGVKTVITLVRKLKLCKGIQVSKKQPESKARIYESYIMHGDENTTKYRIRSRKCQQVLPFLSTGEACRKCRIGFIQSSKKCDKQNPDNTVNKEEVGDNIILTDRDDKDMAVLLSKVFPNASPEMKILMKSQYQALSSKSAKARRWDPKVIKTCLTLWNRSPQAYRDLRDSQMLVLPSGRLLRHYKSPKYLRKLNVLKKEAHQEQIKKSTCAAFTLQTVKDDKSINKQQSHLRLQSEIDSNPSFIESMKMNKTELALFSDAYSIPEADQKTKGKMLSALTLKVKDSAQMPQPEVFSRHTSQSLEQDENESLTTEPQPGSSGISLNRKKKSNLKEPAKKRQRSIKWPCGICGENCLTDAVCCDICHAWSHFDCVGLSGDDIDEDEWICEKCLKDT